MSSFFVFNAEYAYLLIILLVGLFFVWQKKEIKKRIVYLSLFSLPLSYIVAKIAGKLFYNPRPFVVDKITPLIYHAADNGFPSDHTLLSATLAFIVFCFNKKAGGLLIVLALLVGYARVFVGVHHFVDIVGSVVIAGVVVLGVNEFLKKKKFFILEKRN